VRNAGAKTETKCPIVRIKKFKYLIGYPITNRSYENYIMFVTSFTINVIGMF